MVAYLSRVYFKNDNLSSAHFNRKMYSTMDYYYYWNRIQKSIDNIKWLNNFPGNIYVNTNFMEPYPRIIECDILILSYIQLLEQYAYNLDAKYVKITIGYIMNFSISGCGPPSSKLFPNPRDLPAREVMKALRRSEGGLLLPLGIGAGGRWCRRDLSSEEALQDQKGIWADGRTSFSSSSL